MIKESPEVPADKPEARVFQLGKVAGQEQKTNAFENADMQVVGMDDRAKTVSITAALQSRKLHDEIAQQLAHGEGPVKLDLRGMELTDEDLKTIDNLNTQAVTKGSSVELSVDSAVQSEQIRAAGLIKNGLRVVTDAQLNQGALKKKADTTETRQAA